MKLLFLMLVTMKQTLDYETNLSRTCGNVWEMSSDAAEKTMESDPMCFIKVIECLQYLARQGQAMHGDTDMNQT